jgi:hypothetical protein
MPGTIEYQIVPGIRIYATGRRLASVKPLVPTNVPTELAVLAS